MSKISVIIPTYNTASYISEAIDSILKQTILVDEIIVIDDGSTDNTREIVEKLPVKYLYQKNMGAGVARNQGVKLAKNELIAFLDADDLWLPKKLEEQLNVFATKPSVNMVFGYVEHFFSPDIDDTIRQKVSCPTKPQKGISPITLLIHKTDWNKVGEMNTSLGIGEFIEWYGRAKDAGLTTYHLDEIVAKRRLHNNNQGLKKRDLRSDYLQILKARINQQRKLK